MAIKVKDQPIMPGGWHFMQYFRGQMWRIDADGLDQLYDNVLRFRLDHSLPAGTWKDDVDQQICQKYPHQCSQAAIPFIAPGPTGPRLIDRLTAWADSMMRLKRQFVGPEEATRRAHICAGCPKNINWEHECPTCVTNAKRLLTIIRENRDVPNSENVKACQVDFQDNRTACWLDRSLLGSRDGRDQRCWM